jgi:hypothetical protein
MLSSKEYSKLINKLSIKFLEIKNENIFLKEEIEKLKEANETLENTNKRHIQEIDSIKRTEGSIDNKEINKKVDLIVREIEECIRILDK